MTRKSRAKGRCSSLAVCNGGTVEVCGVVVVVLEIVDVGVVADVDVAGGLVCSCTFVNLVDE